MGRRLTEAWLAIHPLPCDGEFELDVDSTPAFVPGRSYLPPATPELLTPALELWQPPFLRFQHFVHHAPDLGQGANRARQWIQHDSVIDSFGTAAQRSLDDQLLHVDVRPVQRSQLWRKGANLRWLDAVRVHQAGYLDAAALG